MAPPRRRYPRSSMSARPLVVLYDRDCGFCAWTAAWLRRADRDGRLRFVPLQEAPHIPGLAAIATTFDLRCALHTVDERGVVHAGGDAMLEILERLPGGRLIGAWRRLPGAAWLADRTYALAADRRDDLGRLVGAAPGTACEVPR
jgi:predicted DCC family thiol-disulfide oxidoreductase YuxK